ncbi:MAG TPA: PAS domain S-box protein [Candidatus Egerieimonas intestinavium]|uniref:histidine kinase n=1 Tax=Candidatus Egerieimonas intestinavium TaxID=2840777 RepID=A0A9D1JGP3_9FIRM|nr:PAS domain S-box protein [Candidatus Egerieimonas intestinavium]
MKEKIIKYTSILIAIAVLATFVAVSLVMYGRFSAAMKRDVRHEAMYLKIMVEREGVEAIDDEVGDLTDTRITVIDPEGDVTYDSMEDPASLERHEDRPEVQEAQKNGTGEATRYSMTLSQQTFYHAVLLSDGSVLRAAATTDSVLATMMSALTLVGLLVVGVIILGIFLIYRQTARMMEPLKHLDLEHPLRNSVYPELKPLMRQLEKQNEQIAHQMKELKTNQANYLAITEYMEEGLMLTSRERVISLNQAAERFLGQVSEYCVGKPIDTVVRIADLQDAIEDALEGHGSEKVVVHGERSYQILTNPVKISGRVQGTVALILDITDKWEAEELRREFSANVSHELKTPLMSISGYAELIENGLVQPGDIPSFAGRIHQEAVRLSNLVADIMKLSQLDEAAEGLLWEEVSLKDLTQEVCGHLQVQAAQHKVELDFSGEECQVYGVRQVLFEMCFNLCENAIKYNREGGSVKIRLEDAGDKIRWSVKDTGIGIAPEHQGRVFERFYRVDKSHSRKTGGTGLGLSIVKHGAALHHAEITLESASGEGTEITLEFPREQK